MKPSEPPTKYRVPICLAVLAIGLALYPDDGRDVDTLIQVADRDRYSRKPAVA